MRTALDCRPALLEVSSVSIFEFMICCPRALAEYAIHFGTEPSARLGKVEGIFANRIRQSLK